MVVSRVCRTWVAIAAGVILLASCSTEVDRSGATVTAESVVLHGISTHAEYQPFVDQLKNSSHGSLTIAFESGWHLQSVAADSEAIAAVRAGSVAYAAIPVRAWHAAGVNSFDALIAPMVVDSYALQDAVLQDPMAGEMLKGVDQLGLTGIGIQPGPLRKPVGITRKLLEPKDFDGAQIAFSDGVVAARSLAALGATAVPSTFEGANMKPFDGLEQHVASVEGNDYDGAATSVTGNVNLWPRPFVVVGNAKAVAKLSDPQRALLMSAARQAIPATGQAQLSDERATAKVLCTRAKIDFTIAGAGQLEQFRQAFAPVDDWLAQDPQTKKFLDRIQQLRTTITASDESIPACTATTTTTPAAPPTPIDGMYQMTDTAQEAKAFGLPDNDELAANTGTFTWIFSRGRFSENQRMGDTDTWASGRYQLNGDSLTVTYEDGGGTGPYSQVHRHPGEVDTWKWSLYHGQLTVRWTVPSLSKSEYPANYTVKPWARLGDAPAVLPTPTG